MVVVDSNRSSSILIEGNRH